MDTFLKFDDIQQLVMATTGFAGGLGYEGAACGLLTSGSLILGLSSASQSKSEDDIAIAVRGSMKVNEYVHQFKQNFGSTLCEGIIERDFSDNWQVRKHVLFDSLSCMNLASKAAILIADILNKADQSFDNHLLGLINEFSNRNFHCANSVMKMIVKKTNMGNRLPERMLIPLNGGIGYNGSTCAALLGGCLAIGMLWGADTSPGGMFKTVATQIKTFTRGSVVPKTSKLSPSSNALIGCSELFVWFEKNFKSFLCCEITGANFLNKHDTHTYFSQDGVSKCMGIAEKTAKKVEELAFS
jgi:hypothetical protein